MLSLSAGICAVVFPPLILSAARIRYTGCPVLLANSRIFLRLCSSTMTFLAKRWMASANEVVNSSRLASLSGLVISRLLELSRRRS